MTPKSLTSPEPAGSASATPDYAELVCISNFSFLQGASHPQELVRQAATLGYRALALTDECSLAGIVRAHEEAQRCRAAGAPLALIPGSVVRCRPVGMLQMEDESGPDAKILAVPIDKLTTLFRDVNTFRDLPRELLDRISHFFDHYKDLEAGKWVNIGGWVGVDAAKQEILESVERYRAENGGNDA